MTGVASRSVMHVHELEELRSEERRPPKPVAAMPPHALLALQRSAGNQAVGRLLARSMYKHGRGAQTEDPGAMTSPGASRRRRRRCCSRSTTGCAPALEPPVPEIVADGRRRQLEARNGSHRRRGHRPRFDTAAALEIRRRGSVDRGARCWRKQLTAEGQGEAARRSTAAPQTPHLRGRLQGRRADPTGYHSITRQDAVDDARGVRRADRRWPTTSPGVYQRSVRSRAAPTEPQDVPQSTFFPDTASEDDVLDAITSVYGVTPKPSSGHLSRSR